MSTPVNLARVMTTPLRNLAGGMIELDHATRRVTIAIHGYQHIIDAARRRQARIATATVVSVLAGYLGLAVIA